MSKEAEMAEKKCETCNGTGFVDSANPNIPIKPCPTCGGTGKGLR